MKPKLAIGNIYKSINRIKEFAGQHELQGIDWSFDMDGIPFTPLEEARWLEEQSLLSPFEVRYHCPFYQIDLGHDDPIRASEAGSIFRRIIRIVSKARGKYLTLHIGLGRNSTEPLSWEATIDNLKRLVQFGADHNVMVCLENLAWGWTSKPNLFEKLVRRSGAGITFDIGHAHVSESVSTQQYSFGDFVIPHPNRVFNAHVYHTEIPGHGHVPPHVPEDIRERLSVLLKVNCNWWVIEIKDPETLLSGLTIIRGFLEKQEVTLMDKETQ